MSILTEISGPDIGTLDTRWQAGRDTLHEGKKWCNLRKCTFPETYNASIWAIDPKPGDQSDTGCGFLLTFTAGNGNRFALAKFRKRKSTLNSVTLVQLILRANHVAT